MLLGIRLNGNSMQRAPKSILLERLQWAAVTVDSSEKIVDGIRISATNPTEHPL